MIRETGTRSLSRSSGGFLPIVAAIAIILIMVGAAVIILLGGSVSIHLSLP